ncbi:MAG: hypothetical protein R2710_04620 [Acidimicrobiales bacterium]
MAWTVFGEFRGDNSELKNLVHLEDELDGDETGATDGPSTDGPSADQ